MPSGKQAQNQSLVKHACNQPEVHRQTNVAFCGSLEHSITSPTGFQQVASSLLKSRSRQNPSRTPPGRALAYGVPAPGLAPSTPPSLAPSATPRVCDPVAGRPQTIHSSDPHEGSSRMFDRLRTIRHSAHCRSSSEPHSDHCRRTIDRLQIRRHSDRAESLFAWRQVNLCRDPLSD